jgi:hypothetical protein
VARYLSAGGDVLMAKAELGRQALGDHEGVGAE